MYFAAATDAAGSALDLRIDYLKPATLAHLIAEARVERMTRTIAFVSGVAYQDGPNHPGARRRRLFWKVPVSDRAGGTTEVPS